jgi:hypothetical protein
MRIGRLRSGWRRCTGKANPDTVAAIIRITGSDFRLLNRHLTHLERILEINALEEVTKAVAETARDTLVIGQD